MILFSGKIEDYLQRKLIEENPTQQFIFCANMEEARKALSLAEILVTYGEDLTDELIEEAVSLKWIMVLSAGMEKMPFEAIKQRDILVTNARGIHRIPMAEYAISMILQVYRQTKKLIEHEKAHEWAKHLPMEELHGKTMLILGAGAIGQEVARVAKAFHVKTLGVSRSGRSLDYFDEVYQMEAFQSLLPQADIFISILPSTKETQGMLQYGHLEALPNHALFLNMGRGDVIDFTDIIRAVNEGQIAHAVLDVFEQEPLPADNPLWDNDAITLTPHISASTKHYDPRALEIFQKNLLIYNKDKKDYVNEIDVTRGY
ncbi:D-2-hydroxyacid dehydrogenase [Oceanobacillus manasiensis]|uniref:D-2-hydroxyacid dehydrogenase n=1 Tax=Oceanobacillus manasiensis TaxID=586413 RepID=UPI000693DB51|nr:D-2-hydroxyacid dehydrogenase [Oceanobacillus manasiensis]